MVSVAKSIEVIKGNVTYDTTNKVKDWVDASKTLKAAYTDAVNTQCNITLTSDTLKLYTGDNANCVAAFNHVQEIIAEKCASTSEITNKNSCFNDIGDAFGEMTVEEITFLHADA